MNIQGVRSKVTCTYHFSEKITQIKISSKAKISRKNWWIGSWISIIYGLCTSQLVIFNRWLEALNDTISFFRHCQPKMTDPLIMFRNNFFVLCCLFSFLPACTSPNFFGKYTKVNKFINIVLGYCYNNVKWVLSPHVPSFETEVSIIKSSSITLFRTEHLSVLSLDFFAKFTICMANIEKNFVKLSIFCLLKWWWGCWLNHF